ncbi:MAG: hypothetical protein IIA83_03395, partial [Thaumarchaeota archaeon]|nr:hypothetical protein [Nitrososphaerota archaeon]
MAENGESGGSVETGSTLDTLTGEFYGQLNPATKSLFDRLEGLTEHNAAYKAIKPQILNASNALRDVYDSAEVEDEIEITNKFQNYAKTYLEAAGMNFKDDDVLYASQMKRMLDKNYGKVREAIKIGDIDELAVLFKNAWASENWAAQVEDVAERIKFLSSSDKVAFAQAGAERLEGTNYAK